MQLPSVVTTLRDPNKEVTYHVRAYRTLSKAELLQAVAAYLRGRKVKRGMVVTIVTVIGADGS